MGAAVLGDVLGWLDWGGGLAWLNFALLFSRSGAMVPFCLPTSILNQACSRAAVVVVLGAFLSYLAYPADVLVAVLLGEAKVLVQAEAHVVAVEAVGGVAEVEQVLLEGGGDGGLAGGGEAGEPEGEALLLAVLATLLASEAGVPGDVAVVRK